MFEGRQPGGELNDVSLLILNRAEVFGEGLWHLIADGIHHHSIELMDRQIRRTNWQGKEVTFQKADMVGFSQPIFQGHHIRQRV